MNLLAVLCVLLFPHVKTRHSVNVVFARSLESLLYSSDFLKLSTTAAQLDSILAPVGNRQDPNLRLNSFQISTRPLV